MTQSIFEPTNPFEEALVAAKAKRISIQLFLFVLINSELAVPCVPGSEREPTGIRTTIVEHEGKKMVVVFSSPDRASGVPVTFQNLLKVKAREFLGSLPSDCGIVINPGYQEGLELSAEGMANVMKDFG